MPNAKPGNKRKLNPRRITKSSAYAALKKPKNPSATVKNFFIKLLDLSARGLVQVAWCEWLGAMISTPPATVPRETLHETRLLALYES